jgi:hypothetical protein
MSAVAAVVVLVLLFTALGGLSVSGRRAELPAEPAAAPAGEAGEGEKLEAPERSAETEEAGEGAALADRYYFKGAWFTVTIHPADGEGHRIDLVGPLCPKCHEPMLRAREREPLETLDDLRTEVYKCHRSTVHPLVTVQLPGTADLPEQARSACLHQLATGEFSSPSADAGPGGDGTDRAEDKGGAEPPAGSQA